MSEPLRVALLGCGRVAELFHLPLLAGLPDVDLVAVAEPDVGRHEIVRRHAPQAQVVEDYRVLGAYPDVEAIVVCLPSALHAEAACAAFEAGQAVYLEKPIAIAQAEGQLVVDRWRRSGAVGMVGFSQRFDPLVSRLRRELLAGRVGETATIRITVGSAARSLPAWKRQRASGGGVLLDLGSHAADLARYLLADEVESVSATTSAMRAEEDTAELTMKLGRGTLAHAHLSLAAGQESRVEVSGDRGVLVADRYAGTLEWRPPRPPYARPQRALAAGRQLWAGAAALTRVARPPRDSIAFRLALAAFVSAARMRRSLEPDIEDGARSLAIVLAAERSAAGGGRVEVEELGE